PCRGNLPGKENRPHFVIGLTGSGGLGSFSVLLGAGAGIGAGGQIGGQGVSQPCSLTTTTHLVVHCSSVTNLLTSLRRQRTLPQSLHLPVAQSSQLSQRALPPQPLI